MRSIRHITSRSTFCVGLVWIVVFALTGCGGDDKGSPAPIARLQVEPSAMLFTEPGRARALKVRAFDAEGNELSAPAQLTITSSKPELINVLPDSQVQAVRASGSALITVSAGGVTAPPVTALIADLQPGVELIDDAQVVSQPVLLGSPETAGLGSQFRMTLRGAPALAPGTLVIASGGSRIAGKVVGVSPAGDQTDVILELVRLNELVKNLDIDLEIPARPIDVEFGSSDGRRSQPQRVRPAVDVISEPIKCDSVAGAELVTMNGRLTFNPYLFKKLRIVDGKVQELVLAALGDVTGELRAVLALGSTSTTTLRCRLRLLNAPIPLDGPIGLVITPSIPLGLETSIKLVIQPSLLNLTARVKPELKWLVGFSYEPSTGVLPLSTFDPKFDFRGEASAAFTLRWGAKLFGGVLSGISAQLAGGLKEFNFVDATAGPELEMNYGFVRDTMSDPAFDASYKLRANLGVKPSSDVLKLLNLFEIVDGKEVTVALTANLSTELARSPKGEFARLNDGKTSFKRGEAMQFLVGLSQVVFGDVYNVAEVRVYRKARTPLAVEHLVVAKRAEPGQTTFALDWIADEDSSPNMQYAAYVVPVAFETIGREFPFPLKEFVFDVDQYIGDFDYTLTNPGFALPLRVVSHLTFVRYTPFEKDSLAGTKVYVMKSGSVTVTYGTSTVTKEYSDQVPALSYYDPGIRQVDDSHPIQLPELVIRQGQPSAFVGWDGTAIVRGLGIPGDYVPLAGGFFYSQPSLGYAATAVADDFSFLSSRGATGPNQFWHWTLTKH